MRKGLKLGLVAVFFYSGCVGIWYTQKVTAGPCSAYRGRYFVKPFLWRLKPMLPSFDTAIAFEERNANAEVLQCLCRDRTVNADTIISFAHDHVNLMGTERQAVLEYACTAGARKVYVR
jgi:hypothetical protein